MRYNKQYFEQLVFLCSVLAMPLTVSAQTASERATEVSGGEFVRAFLGNCSQSPGDFNRTVATANALGHSDLPAEMKPLVAPQDPEAEFIGYYAQTGEAAPYLMGVSKSDVNGESITICAVANPYINTAEVVSALQSFFQLGAPDVDETAMGLRHRNWFTDDLPKGAYIWLVDGQPMGYDGATLSLLSPSIN